MAGVINFLKRGFLIAILAGLLNAVVAYFELIKFIPKSITTINSFITQIITRFEANQEPNIIQSSIVIALYAFVAGVIATFLL